MTNWVVRLRDASANLKWKDVFLHYKQSKHIGLQYRSTTDHTIYPLVMKASSSLTFPHGACVHASFLKQGLDLYTSVANSVMNFYTKFGSFDSALRIFGGIGNGSRDDVSWNVIVYGGLSLGEVSDGLRLFWEGRVVGFEANVATVVVVVKALKDVGDVVGGRKIHGWLMKSGVLFGCVSVENCLIGLYGDFDVGDAGKLFDEMFERDVISWSVMISGFVGIGEGRKALKLFREMVCEGRCEADEVTVVGVLNACASLGNVGMARSVHRIAICRGFDEDLYVGNGLVDAYSKCGDLYSALQAFKQMGLRNEVSWNSLLSGLVGNEKYTEALLVYEKMGKEGMEFDEVTLVNLLQMCKHFEDPLQCKSVHGHAFRRAMESNHLLVNSLLDVYARCNLVEFAWKLFILLNRKDVISWSTMMIAFTNCGRPDEALILYKGMVEAKEVPNAVTILNLIDACSLLSEQESKWAHGIAIRKSFAEEVMVGTAILDMYSKCGLIESAKRAFNQISNKNIISWSAMITAYGMNGLTQDALALHTHLKLHGPKPNGVTYLAVLSACSHGGMVPEGLSIFKEMVQINDPEPETEHYSCMVDMLGRAGSLEMALDLINSMPKKLKASPNLWSGLLSACRSYGNFKLIPRVVAHLLELDPSNSAGYLLASSIHAANGTWDDAAKLRSLAKKRGVKSEAGYSLVHIDDKSRRFLAGDESHPQIAGIVSSAQLLHQHIRTAPLLCD